MSWTTESELYASIVHKIVQNEADSGRFYSKFGGFLKHCCVWFQTEYTKVVIALLVVQFWSEIKLVIVIL